MTRARGVWRRPEHAAIASILERMDGKWLLRNKCWFGGGTAVVLLHGEYRLSRDMDFLCADPDGYRELRLRAVREGVRGFFASDVTEVREFRCDQYGIRCAVGFARYIFKFEVIRETRISLTGHMNDLFGVPTLSCVDLIAEKILANADRGLDRAAAYRDVIDIGHLLLAHRGVMPEDAIAKAEAAYGEDARHKLDDVLARLDEPLERRWAADTLGMEPARFDMAVAHVRSAVASWPTCGPDQSPMRR